MRIRDVVYFAPDVRFDEVDLDSPKLPEQFRSRMLGFYIEPAEVCAGNANGYAFASGVLLVTCIDALARFRYGEDLGVEERFRKFATEELPSFSNGNGDLAYWFWERFRNGLVHQAELKDGAQFSLQITATVVSLNGFLLVNPVYLAEEVRAALDAYVDLLKREDGERQRFRDLLSKDLEADFRAARE